MAQPGSNYIAMVDVFSSSLSCEPGILRLINTTNEASYQQGLKYDKVFTVDMSTSEYQIYNITLGPPTHPSSEYWGQMQKVTCSNLPLNHTTRNRVIFTMVYFAFDSSGVHKILSSSTAVCKTTYAINTASVTLNGSSIVSNLTLNDRPSRRLAGISGADIAQGIVESLPTMNIPGVRVENPINLMMSDIYYSGVLAQSWVPEANTRLDIDGFFTLMIKNNTLNPSAYVLPSAYLNYEVLTKWSIPMYNMLAAQVASQYLTIFSGSSDSSLSITGSTIELQERLTPRNVPVRLMESILLVTVCLTVLVSVVTPHNVAPRSPDSIAVLAAVFPRNPTAIAKLRGAGHFSLDAIRSIISKMTFWTATEMQHSIPIFAVRSSVSHSSSEDTEPTDSNTKQSHFATMWYQPLAFGIPSKIALSFFPIAIIAALEVTLRVSDSNSGITAVDDSTLTKYCCLYIPVIILGLIGTLFNVLEFQVESLEPYHTLSTGYSQATDGLLQHPLRNIPVHTMWIALRFRSFALLATSVAGILAPFLTIIVSGLLSKDNIGIERTVNVRAISWFNMPKNPNISTVTQDIQQGITTSLIIHKNMSHPAWTYDELAFPEISIQENGTLIGVTNATELSVIMPALRNVLNCTVVPQNRILNASTVTSASNATLHYNISCNAGEDLSKTIWVSSDNATVPVPIDGYFNYLFIPGEEGCPPMMMFFGQVSPNKTEHFTALTCNPYLASISVDVVLSLPDFSFLGKRSPVIDESSANYYSDWFPSVIDLDEGFLPLNRSTNIFTPFFQAVVYGKDGVPAVELKDNPKLIESLEHVYRQFAAQILNTNLRDSTYSVPPNRTNVPNGLWNASVQASQPRLIQSALSTRLLQVILGVLLLCAIVVFLTMDTRRVLPKPPYTIAAVASLLAGSRLISEHEHLFPPGVEWYTDKRLEKCEIWQGKLFRMGWWDSKDGERERDFRIDVKERTNQE